MVEFFATHPHTHGKITAYGLTNRFEYFDTKAHAVFKRTAPLIGPFIGAGRPELIHQMLVGTADFHTIQTRLLDANRGLTEVVDDAFDFVRLDDFCRTAVNRFADAAGAHQMRPVAAPKRVAPAHMGRLNHDVRAVAMNRISQVAKVFDTPVMGNVDR